MRTSRGRPSTAAPRRLVLDTRFTFAPAFAAASPHTTTFEIEPAGAGSRVLMRVDVADEGPVRRLFENEGAGVLQGLRVAIDPAVQAELARRERIGEVAIHDVTAERIADYQAFFDNDAFRDYPAWSTCYCMETHFGGTPEAHLMRTAADNRAEMSRLLASGEATALLTSSLELERTLERLTELAVPLLAAILLWGVWRRHASEARPAGSGLALLRSGRISPARRRGKAALPLLVAGPPAPTDRFTYWPVRVARGGTILAPVGPSLPVQFIDARDLAAWIVLQVENLRAGACNVTGKPRTVSMGDVIETCKRVAGVQPGVRWASEAFLEQRNVGEWVEMPLWISRKSELPGMTNVNVSRALACGLELRPLAQTVRDTLAWAVSSRKTRLGAGLDPEREAELAAALPG